MPVLITETVAQMLTAQSPSCKIAAELEINEAGRLSLSIQRDGDPVSESSLLGITVDGVDLGSGITWNTPQTGSIDETYPTRGWHSKARNHCNFWLIPITHLATGTNWVFELRMFDDGVAYRYLVPGEGERTIQGEASSWTIPAGSQVWIAERNNAWKLKSYAGWWMKTDVDTLPTISSEGPVQAPPLVVELPEGGYAAITEAALTNYSGMRLRAIGHRTVQADFTEGTKGFAHHGMIVTPFRVLLTSPDLNGMVNSDILTNLNPPPDRDLFSDPSYIRLGRVAWRWWSQGTGTPEQEKQYIDYAAELGFEHSLIDDGWEAWPEKWTTVAELCRHAHQRGVGVFVWKDYKDIWNPEENYRDLREFLDGIKRAGVDGVKIDFMNAESADRIAFQQAALKETALRRLMLLFHGCQKPGGESRTWPHEVTREGIRGLELNKMSEGPIPADHNAALPFTRYLTGHGDYTPVGYSNPGDTTWAHQLATAITFTSPLNVIAENPEVLLREPKTRAGLDVLQAIPTVWDETRVLEPSRIGEIAVFARRSGQRWFVGMISGLEEMVEFTLDLSFLGDSEFDAVVLTSPEARGFERVELSGVNGGSRMGVKLNRVDGWVGMFTPAR